MAAVLLGCSRFKSYHFYQKKRKELKLSCIIHFFETCLELIASISKKKGVMFSEISLLCSALLLWLKKFILSCLLLTIVVLNVCGGLSCQGYW